MKAQQEKLKTYLPKVLKRYETYKKSHGGDNLIQRFLQGLLQEVDNEKSIVQYQETDDQFVFVSYPRFYQVSKFMFRDKILELTSQEIGLFCCLFLRMELYSNMLINGDDNKSPMLSKDIMELLELSNEKTKELLEKLLRWKLIIHIQHKPTNALFVNPEYALMKATTLSFNKDYNQKLQQLKLKTPIMINHLAIRFPLFKKNDRNERISHGKRILGTLFRITLQMNNNNEIKIGKHNQSTLLDLICVKTGVDELSKGYLQLLIDSYFLLVKDEVIIVNPYFAKYKKKRKFTNVTWHDVDSLRNLLY
jgi:hypothetical protein